MPSILSICCGEGEEEAKYGAFAEYSDYDWADASARKTHLQKQKIREVEHQITLLNQNRPVATDAPSSTNSRNDSGFSSVSSFAGESATSDVDHAALMRGTIFSPSLEVNVAYRPPLFPKTEEEMSFLREVFHKHFLFDDLSEKEETDLINAMQREVVGQGTTIIKQGDVGDYFYIIEKGRVNFVLNEEGVVGTCKRGGYFGELALLYDCPRAASCVATSHAVELWKVDQQTFRFLVATHSQEHHMSIKDLLSKITLFRDLGPEELNRFTNSLTPVNWKTGDRIVQKGDEGNVFYIVQSGEVKIHDIGLGQSQFEDQLVGPGHWFGERALLTGEPRAANVTANTDVLTLAMDRTTFERILGPLRTLMEREMRRNFLRGLPIFAKGCVGDDELSRIVDMMHELCYRQGDKLAEAGKPYQQNLWIIRHGRLLVYSSKVEGKIYNLQSGDHFGDKSIQGDPDHISSHTAVCEESLTAWVLTRQDIECVLGNTDRLGQTTKMLNQNESVGEQDILLSDLEKRRVLGQGAYGKVWLVSTKESNEAYALKEISKLRLLEANQTKSLYREKEFLALLQHPFILHLVASFQDLSKVYLLLPVIPGGELFSVLHRQKAGGRGLPNDTAAFYGACIIEALGHFHQRNIAYRDLKLENVLIDKDGYCKIVDLGFAKVVESKTYTLVGTPEYLAPEIIMSKGHDKAVDYWAYGVLLYELVVGKSPFYRKHSSQMDMFKRIVRGKYETPEYVEQLLESLISKLLTRQQAKRLGNLKNGYIDVKKHFWFEDSHVMFVAVRRKRATAPWIPPLKDPFDNSNFDNFSSLENEVDTDRYLTKEEQEEFVGF